MQTYIGIFCAIISAFFNGTFTAPFKRKEMTELGIHPMVFQLYCSVGVFLSSWLVLPFLRYNPDLAGDDGNNGDFGDDFAFSFFGFLGGALFVVATSAGFIAIDKIGIALAQGIWGGVAMIVSYLWGTLIFAESPSLLGLSISGVVLLVAGVILIAFCDKFSGLSFSKSSYGPVIEISETEKLTSDISSMQLEEEAKEEENSSPQDYISGVMWACSVGVSGGSILAPLHYVPEYKQGLVFLPSFGTGALLMSPIVFFMYIRFESVEMPQFHVSKALLTGLFSGLLWNIGNLLSLIAIPFIGYSVAYPILQCAILVSGIWGIYVFNEIKSTSAIVVFWIGGAVLLLGGGLLAIAQ